MSQSTTDTLTGDSFVDLSVLPPVYVLTSHLSGKDQQLAENALEAGNAPLTYDAQEANLILGNVSTARRAKLELQWMGIYVIENDARYAAEGEGSMQARKRLKTDSRGKPPNSALFMVRSDSRSRLGTEDDTPSIRPISQLSLSQKFFATTSGRSSTPKPGRLAHSMLPSFEGKVVVASIEWLQLSLEAKQCLPLQPFILYQGKPNAKALGLIKRRPPNHGNILEAPLKAIGRSGRSLSPTKGTIARTEVDHMPRKKSFRKRDRIKEAADQDIVGRSFSSSTQGARVSSGYAGISRPTHLLHQTTSENNEALDTSPPSMPDWVMQNKLYSCERATPLDSPNSEFISQLKEIKLARLLTLDEIGVRAYSTSIASLAAYPYKFQSTKDILALPGCDQKIAHLFHELRTKGCIQAVLDLQADPALGTLRKFYDIWGVGAVTAREFYYEKGWRELDDIIEFGWKSLSRVQQIGLKYYDEFQLKIPRAEVESIAAIITRHATRVTDADLKTIIVGGYRRGKPESGDVDVVLSHPRHEMTLELVSRVIRSLEEEGFVTHTLTLDLTNTKRNQETLPINSGSGGHGFDTLDKALVVWQDPSWPTKAPDVAANPKAKNSNPHRRVDIIITPWRTVGCAVAGWTSGTTFQRDLRRYAKKVKGWKFDSSGVRERATGQWVDLEGWRDESTRCIDWKDAERKVFEGLGLAYREPWDRCTG